MTEKKNIWDVRILQETTLRVTFGEEVTKLEAMRMIANDEYEDVLDEKDSYLTEVIDAD